jgi:PKD repeat protein
MMKNHYFLLLLAFVALSSCSRTPEACFVYEAIGSKVNFDATCSLHAATYDWDFGDGKRSSIATPHHDFPIAGDYTVTLTVATKGGKSSVQTSVIRSNGGTALNSKFNGSYTITETCTTGSYTVAVFPSSSRASEATFHNLWFSGMTVIAVIGAGGTTFSIAQQPIQTDRAIISTTGTINNDGTRINLNYQILNTNSGTVVDECVAVLQR